MNMNLAQFHTYRATNGKEEYTADTRRKVAKKIVTWLNKGFQNDEIFPERKFNNEWVEDADALAMAHRFAAESKNGKTQTVQEVDEQETPYQSMRNLYRLLRVILSGGESNMSDDHIEAVLTAMRAVENSIDAVEINA